LKTKYKAKKVKIPFMWLARFAVSVVRPAGVKSFSVTLFEDLKFSRETLDDGNAVGDAKFVRRRLESDSPRPLAHRRTGLYVYARSGKKRQNRVVTIDKQQAAVIRATFNPEKLAEFINDPKIFGISRQKANRGKNVISSINQTTKEANKKPKRFEKRLIFFFKKATRNAQTFAFF
jgi:hypothetical protein